VSAFFSRPRFRLDGTATVYIFPLGRESSGFEIDDMATDEINVFCPADGEPE